jgi:tRNA pseudouridine38-40 synthase
MLALAAKLPRDIAVWRVDQMPHHFDARRHSIGKRYVYRIYQGAVADPFYRTTTHFVRQRLESASMHDAAQLFVGEHDFTSFRSSHCTSHHARRYVWYVAVRSVGPIIEIDIRGNAFCMNMVRIMVGTLIEIGKRKRSRESICNALTSHDRKSAGPTAPAHGLTLEEVYYPDDLSSAHIPTNARFPRYPVTAESWPQ